MSKSISTAPIIGFVRYSQKRKFGNQAKERDVFEPDYFEYRLTIFKEVTLKSFQQQTDTNFILLLLHSENMPAHYKQRFIELENENLFLYNIFVKDDQESFDCAVLNSFKYTSFKKDIAVTFRVDNDDAVPKNFIESLGKFLKHDFIGYTISIPTINIVKRISNELYMLQDRYYPANSIGLAYVTHRQTYNTILNLGDHHLVNDQNAMIVFSKSKSGVLQTINGENEINSIDKTKAVVLNKLALEHYLAERDFENFNLDCLRIYSEEKKVVKFSALFIPPVFYLVLRKIKALFLK